MIGVKLTVAAACCLLSSAVFAADTASSEQPVSQASPQPKNNLLNDLKTYLTLAEDREGSLRRAIKAYYTAVDLTTEDANAAINAMIKVEAYILKDNPIQTDYNANVPITITDMTPNDKFEKLVDVVDKLKSKTSHLAVHLSLEKQRANPTPPENPVISPDSLKKLYITVEDDLPDVAYNDMIAFNDGLVNPKGAFMDLYNQLEKYKQQRKKKDGSFVKPSFPETTKPASIPTAQPADRVGGGNTTENDDGQRTENTEHPATPTDTENTTVDNAQSNAQDTQGGSASQTTQPQTPQGPSSENTPATPEAAAGNLSGSKPSSATFGGITVATLCFMVLSAF